MKTLIGKKVTDKGSDGLQSCTETILDATTNSILISQTKTNESGINCTSWISEEQIKKGRIVFQD